MTGGPSLDPLGDVVVAMDRLRSPGGCPWDAEQTHRTLAPYAVEEAYELAEAAETDDRAALRAELGDLLLQVIFHARVAEEDPQDPFNLADVAQVLLDKLHRRHPHVFGDSPAARSVAEVEQAWHEIKELERAATSTAPGAAPHGTGVLDSIPLALPALARAQKVARRLRREHVTDTDLLGEHTVAGHGPKAAPGVDENPEDEAVADLGRELMALVLRAESLGTDAESALRAHVRQITLSMAGST